MDGGSSTAVLVMGPFLFALVGVLGCHQPSASSAIDSGPKPAASFVAGRVAPNADDASVPLDSDETRAYRAALLRQLAFEIKDERVLAAMARVPRHLFVPGVSLRRAYVDAPAPIGYGQTISQPTVVAIMTQALELRGEERVLEIGTGSGYQAAILSLLASDVYTIEIVRELADESRARLADLGYANVHVRAGDGYKGWPEHAPFDRILLTAAPDDVPHALFDQLAEGGVLVAPVGATDDTQSLYRYRKIHGRISTENLGDVRFVPMIRGD